MLIVSREKILAGLQQYPCDEYLPDRIEAIFDDREKMPVLEALQLPLPPQDLLRAALLYEGVLPDSIKHELRCRYAEYALRKTNTPDPRSVAAVAAKRAWLRGEIDDEALATATAAWSAAATAAWLAEETEATATAVARAEARAAATAAWSAAATAAWSAAATAWSAEAVEVATAAMAWSAEETEATATAVARAEARAAATAAWGELLQITIDYITEIEQGERNE